MRFVIFVFLAAALLAQAGDPPKESKKKKKGESGQEEKEEKPKPKVFAGFVVVGNVLQPEAELAPMGKWNLGAASMASEDAIKADAKGRFETKVEWEGALRYFAVDKARKMGVLQEVKAEELAKPVTVRLAPLVKVRVKLVSEDARFGTEGAWVQVSVKDVGVLGACTATAEGLAMMLPPGEYGLEVWREGFQHRAAALTVPAGRPEFAAPDVKLAPTLLRTHVGKSLPEWTIADALGVPKETKLADYRGKWVVIEFWRYSCPSCRGWGIPNLVKFYERYPAWRDRLQVVAFHNSEPASGAELCDLLGKEKGVTWAIGTLPFPVLIDAKENGTVDAWGPGEFPHAVLVDPEGKLVMSGTLEEVEKRVNEAMK